MKLTYDEFKARFIEDFKDILPEDYSDYEVVVKRVTKNNGCVMEGISLVDTVKHESGVTPAFYLDTLYDSYIMDDKTYDEVLVNAAVSYVHAMQNKPTNITDKFIEAMDNPEMFKELVQFRLANEELNQEYLENSPHRKVQDMAIIYAISLKEAPEYSTRITNELLERVGITEEELYTAAMANLKSERITLKNMGEILVEIAEEHGMPLDHAPELPMYLLTNESKLFGSRSILNSEMLEDIREKLGENYYILPSSIHEVIVVKEGAKSPEELREIVYNINKGILDEKDFLSDNIYYYDGMLRMHDSPEIEW